MLDIIYARYDEDDATYENVDHYIVYENGKLVGEVDANEFHEIKNLYI